MASNTAGVDKQASMMPSAITRSQMDKLVYVTCKDNTRVVRPVKQSIPVLGYESFLPIQISGSTPTNALTSGQQFDFQIVCPQRTKLKGGMTIEWNCSETSGSNSVTPIPAPLFVGTMEYYLGSSLQLTIDQGEHNWWRTGIMVIVSIS